METQEGLAYRQTKADILRRYMLGEINHAELELQAERAHLGYREAIAERLLVGDAAFRLKADRIRSALSAASAEWKVGQ